MYALDVRKEMEMQTPITFLALHSTEKSIGTTSETAHKLSIASHCILAWELRIGTMRTVRTHSDAQDSRQNHADLHHKRIGSCQWIFSL